MKLPRSFRVEAVVLRHSDWGEADRLLTLFTRQHGKLRAIAKGARRIRSRKAGHLEPFMHVTLQLARGHDLFIVTQADTLQAFLPIHDDLGKTSQAAYTIELLDRFTYEDETENIHIFQLLTKTLLRIEKEDEPWLAIRWYEIQLLDLLGYRPHLFECARCGREIQGRGPVLFRPAGRCDLSHLWKRSTGGLAGVDGGAEVSAPLPAQRLCHSPEGAAHCRTEA